MTAERICLLGFGEVGQTLARDMANCDLSAWDAKFPDPRSGPRRAEPLSRVKVGASAADAIAEADIVISAVTAAQDVAAAQEAAGSLKAGAFYLDLNSVSPEVKKASAKLIHRGGGRFVEAAVMAPIATKRIATAMLLGGPHAEAFLPLAQELGFINATVFSAELGQASAAKMCRSVVVKGMEALLIESLLSAHHYGVEEVVLTSLEDLLPCDWRKLARYMISRALEHGARRAEEMREAAHAVTDSGIEPLMSNACAVRQDWAAQFPDALAHGDLLPMLAAIRAQINDSKKKIVAC